MLNPLFDVGYGPRARHGVDLVGAFIAININAGPGQGLIDGFMNSIVSFMNSVLSSARGFRALLLIYTNQCPETTTKTLNQCIRLGRLSDCLGGECGDAFIIEGSAKVGIDVIKGLIMRKAPQTGSAGNPQPMFRAVDEVGARFGIDYDVGFLLTDGIIKPGVYEVPRRLASPSGLIIRTAAMDAIVGSRFTWRGGDVTSVVLRNTKPLGSGVSLSITPERVDWGVRP